MSKRDRSVNVHASFEARAPHRTRKIAQSVRGKQRRLFEWRTKKCAGKMRDVMLDAMELCGKFCGIHFERGGQRFADAAKFRQYFHSFSRKGWHPQHVKQFCAHP